MEIPTGNIEFREWILKVMALKPKGSYYINCERGKEVTELALNFERDDFNWHRSDEDIFWIDIQLFVKYKLSNEEILFILKQQPGVVNYSKYAKERNAYAEMMRGLNKLRQINTLKEMQDEKTTDN